MRGAMKLGRFVMAAALLAVAGAWAAEERADFTTGMGTNGWTVSNGVYASPLYSNAVDCISLSYSSAIVTDVATVYATAPGGAEAQIATLAAASSAAAAGARPGALLRDTDDAPRDYGRRQRGAEGAEGDTCGGEGRNGEVP